MDAYVMPELGSAHSGVGRGEAQRQPSSVGAGGGDTRCVACRRSSGSELLVCLPWTSNSLGHLTSRERTLGPRPWCDKRCRVMMPIGYPCITNPP